VGHITRIWEMRNAYKILVVKPEGKTWLGRRGRRLQDNITMDLREMGLEGMDCIRLTQDRDRWRALANTAMNLGVP
jgi:hypothetical protein